MANLSNINNKFLVTTAGNVGIGTTSPGYKLNVINDNTATWTARFTNNTNNVYLSVNDANNYGIYVSGETKNYFSGNIGIGTTSPQDKLNLHTSSASGNIGMKITRGTETHGLRLGVNSSHAFLWTTEAQNLVFATSGIQRISILSGGNVGIGVTGPTYKLQVAGTTLISGGLKVIGPGSYNTFQSGNDYTLGLNDYNSVSQWWLKAYTTGDFALHENTQGDRFTIKAGGNVGIGITSPGTTLQVSGSNLTNNVAAYIGSGFVNNDLYHREGGLLVISGTNATQTSAGIAFQTRNTGNTNYWKSSILMNRGGELEFYTGGAGTGQGSERMKITSGGNIQIPTDSASLQLRSSGSGAYTSIRRDAANQLIVANTANNQVFGIGNGGELAITNGASYTTTLTYTTGWNSSYQTLIPGNSLSPNAVYIVTIKCDSFGTPPYYASTVFHIATSPGTNGSGGGNDNIAPTATHVNSTVYWKYRLSTIVNGKNGVEAYLSGGPTPNGTTIYVKATKIMTM